MEFSNTLSVPVDMVPPEIQTNIENIQRTSLCQYLIGFGNFLIYLICFCVLVALPMIELIIGIIYLKECSMNNLIPIYLIVAGLISSIILMFIILGVKYSKEYFFDLYIFFLVDFYLAIIG